MKKDEKFLSEILKLADVNINGSRPWDILVKNENFYRRIFSDGVLGLGESYMDGWWDCNDLDEFIYKVLKADIEHKIYSPKFFYFTIKSKILNLQSKNRAAKDVSYHYNLGNVLFRNMLDKTMTYSCAYWKDAKNLDEAQEAKLKLICNKVGLKPGITLLDIGCGWGSLMKYAAENFGIRCVGITLSTEQAALGKDLCKGLPVEIKLQDYRDIKENYDRIVSVGMIEHVGSKNYRTFMKIVHQSLNDDGLFLLHTIGATNSTTRVSDPWMDKYIFPGSALPSADQIALAAEDLFIMEDWHNFGFDYSKTLRAWFDNFITNWDNIKSDYYNDRFFRMWKYFLLIQSGSFRARRNQLWQIVFSKYGVQGGYTSIR